MGCRARNYIESAKIILLLAMVPAETTSAETTSAETTSAKTTGEEQQSPSAGEGCSLGAVAAPEGTLNLRI
jgi:hypothetical protein